jgi:hypothetical protein
VYLANKYEVDEWYEDAYVNLAKRSKPLEVAEAQRLGWDITVKLARVREERLAVNRCDAGYCHANGGGVDGDPQLRRIVRKVFGLF